MDKIINKIQKKIDAIEKLHDKESLMCEEVKDLLEELRENQEEDNVNEDDFEEEFDEEEIDEEEDK
jgi:aminoglycoside phosphotransferase|tara:strand:+ start:711 stop:908 length:198 start_codon:yes stop_codon:yes gene_type:complete